ncbi:MAG: hypothetical protein WCT37_00105 [Patescibacteria group bacterium]|jgi:hypothetical protein
MTRIETGLPADNYGGADLREPIKAEAPAWRPEQKAIRHRSFFSCFNCLGIAVLFFAVVVGGAAVVAARTGLVSLPVLTALVYQPPEPIHWVKNNAPRPLPNLTAPASRLVLDEASLTKSLQGSVQEFNLSQERLQIRLAQVAIEPDNLEIFAQFSRPAGGYLSFELAPRLANGKLIFIVKKIKLGQLGLPRWLGGIALEQLLNSQLDELLAGSPMVFKAVALETGRLIIDLEPAVK